MTSDTQLREAIGQWDGKSAADITRVYKAFCDASSFGGSLAGLMPDPDLQRGASWLLKHHVGKGGHLSEEEASAVYRCAGHLQHWETRLHVLQAMPGLPIAPDLAQPVHEFLHRCQASERTLLRAWAYSGFGLLSEQYPRFHHEVRALLRQAWEQEQAGSVRVRIRKALE